MLEPLVATVDITPEGERLVYVERLPDRITISPSFFAEVDEKIARLVYNPDDGWRGIFDFANGHAVFVLEKEPDHWRGNLVSWEPSL